MGGSRYETLLEEHLDESVSVARADEMARLFEDEPDLRELYVGKMAEELGTRYQDHGIEPADVGELLEEVPRLRAGGLHWNEKRRDAVLALAKASETFAETEPELWFAAPFLSREAARMISEPRRTAQLLRGYVAMFTRGKQGRTGRDPAVLTFAALARTTWLHVNPVAEGRTQEPEPRRGGSKSGALPTSDYARWMRDIVKVAAPLFPELWGEDGVALAANLRERFPIDPQTGLPGGTDEMSVEQYAAWCALVTDEV